MPDLGRIAVFGGIYNNYLALEAALASAKRHGFELIFYGRVVACVACAEWLHAK